MSEYPCTSVPRGEHQAENPKSFKNQTQLLNPQPKRGYRSWMSRRRFENNYFTKMCSGSEAGSYLMLIDFVYHSTLGLRVIKKKRRDWGEGFRVYGFEAGGFEIQG